MLHSNEQFPLSKSNAEGEYISVLHTLFPNFNQLTYNQNLWKKNITKTFTLLPFKGCHWNII